MKHALVIGGTGMLAEVTAFLKSTFQHVSVIGRDYSKYEQYIGNHGSSFISVDYHDDEQLRSEIQKAIKNHDGFNLIVAWIHSSATNALAIILEEAANTKNTFRFFHILGSSANLSQIKANISFPMNCVYRQVQLGFIIESNRSRWLTNHEIATGVIKAIEEDNPLKVIGTIKPWEKRP